MALSKSPVPSTNEVDEEVRLAFRLTPPLKALCMHCLEPVAHPCIYWSIACAYPSSTDEDDAAMIYLHRACAVSFAQGLLRDAVEMDRWEAVARAAKPD